MGSARLRASAHRDLYLDTPDGRLRKHAISCRIRLAAEDAWLSLRSGATPAVRMLVRAAAHDVSGVLAEHNAVTARIRALVDPSELVVTVALEVQRVTHDLLPDLFRRPRVQLHVDHMTVRQNGSAHSFHHVCGHLRRGNPAVLERLDRALKAEHGLRIPADDPRGHAELLLRWSTAEDEGARGGDASDEVRSPVSDVELGGPSMLNAELSLLAFQHRVLAMASNTATPLKERLRFLGIVATNIDEFYMTRMSGLRSAARDPSPAGIQPRHGQPSPDVLLQNVQAALADIAREQTRCADVCLREAVSLGTRMRTWGSLTDDERVQLTVRCRDELYPALTPLAMTLSPGHPLPHLPHLGLSLAVVFRREPGGALHLTELELPADAPRLLTVPGQAGDVITIEELLRGNLALLHPNSFVESAHLFRVTRGGDLALDESEADSLLEAVSEATERRPFNPAVRVEVERTMPAFVIELVLENLRRDAAARDGGVAVREAEVVDGLLDLRCLAMLPLVDPANDGVAQPEARSPLPADEPMLDAIRNSDLLVHHPFDSFDETVVRFLAEAADDPSVTTVRITLYRVGAASPVVAALLRAAAAGKRVVAFVELKARFDEEHNVNWARALEHAGGNVVYGLVGYKTHAKVAMVVRREGTRLQRYVHVGTGNYNVRSGRQYTDLSLFSARDALADDVSDLFNELTGSSRPPQGLRNGALVAPHQLLPAVIDRIEVETRHARAGRTGAIRIKVNGLSDPEVITALYRAAEAGVRIDLVVRGICTLDPGHSVLANRIRVVSVVGGLLEHSRIYCFANDGHPEYLIGSSDLRPRNLRRRVELLVPVTDARHTARLDRILELYLRDASAWDLRSHGEYVQRTAGGSQAQEELGRGADLAPGEMESSMAIRSTMGDSRMHLESSSSVTTRT